MPTINVDTTNFFYHLRLEGKEGPPINKRICSDSYRTYESIAKLTIATAYPNNEEQTSIQMDEYIVKLTEDNDKDSLPIDIVCTEDLKLAIKANSTKGFIKMSATIRRKTDPLPRIEQQAEVARAGNKGTSSSAGKRKAAASKKPSLSTKRSKRGNKEPVRTRILGSLAELRALGISHAPRIQLALFAGYSNVNSAGFAKALSNLKKDNLIEYPDPKTVSLARAGLEADETKGVDPPRDNSTVHERIKDLLKPNQQKMFDILLDGRVHSREEVAQGMNYTNLNSSGFTKSLSTMSSLGLIHYPKDDADAKKKLVQLTDICFPYKIRGDHLDQPKSPLTPTLTEDLFDV